MQTYLRRLVIVSGFVACGSKSPPATSVVANEAPVVVLADAGVETDPACLRECVDRDARLRPYCEETCAPVTEPNEACGIHCRQQHGDDITEAEETSCDAECATVPTVSATAQTICVDVCAEGGARSEEMCEESCDPDPYDYCVYIPCD